MDAFETTEQTRLETAAHILCSSCDDSLHKGREALIQIIKLLKLLGVH